MSFNGDLDSVSTIIHEGGHNVNHQFINEYNPIQYRDASSIVAEVTSLTNECLLSSYLANNGKTKEEKLSGIGNIIDVINANLFGAVREGHMEQEFYEYVENGGTITNDYMNELTKKYIDSLHGGVVKDDDHTYLSWIRRSHYYMFFYLYSYAICISVASYIASEILSGNKDVLDKYIKFLSIGNDVWPIDAFKVLDIDLTKPEVYEKAIKYYEELLNKYEEVYNS
jgi:oligoendopeptidase F